MIKCSFFGLKGGKFFLLFVALFFLKKPFQQLTAIMLLIGLGVFIIYFFVLAENFKKGCGVRVQLKVN